MTREPTAAPAKVESPVTPPTTTPKAGTEQPKYGGSVTRLRELYPDMLDPHLSRGAAHWNDVLGPMYNGLLRLDEKLEIVPDLVEKWEQPSDLVYVLTLRKDVKFHDNATMKGREFTAEDVKYNLQRMASNDPKFMRRSQFQVVSSMELPDKYTVKLTLKEPIAPFLGFMAQPYNYIVGKEAVEKFGDLSRQEAGTGPFSLTIDRQAVIDMAMEGDGIITGPIDYAVAAPWRLSLDELKRLYKVDIPKAKQLMIDAGFPSGFPLEVKVSSLRRNAMDALIVVTQQLKQIGVTAKQEVLEHTTLVSKRESGDYVAMIHGGGLALDPGERITQYFRTGGQYNLSDLELTKLVDEQARIVDVAKRRQVLNQFERLFIEKAYLIMLFGLGDYQVRQPNVKGPQEPSALSQNLVAYAWIEK